MLQACTFLNLQEVHYSMSYRSALIVIRYTIKYIKGVA